MVNSQKKDTKRRITIFLSVLIALTIFFRFSLADNLYGELFHVTADNNARDISGIKVEAIEGEVISELDTKVKGLYTNRLDQKIRSDVGFLNTKVLALEEFFDSYGSKLVYASDDFIEASEEYNIDNWQLLPAIAMAETAGCQTGRSYEQRNCWGWVGPEPYRWEFDSFEDSIDFISKSMKKTYGNKCLNPQGIQKRFCGVTCFQWEWRWAKGVNYYIVKLNDVAEKYDIERTHEIEDWTWDAERYNRGWCGL